MDKITLKEPICILFCGVITIRNILVTEINVLKNGNVSHMCNKEGERFNYEFIDDDSKKIIDEIVKRNKKCL